LLRVLFDVNRSQVWLRIRADTSLASRPETRQSSRSGIWESPSRTAPICVRRAVSGVVCKGIPPSEAQTCKARTPGSEGRRSMSNYDPNATSPGTFAGGAIAVDAGLRAYMLRVYNYMAAGVGLTGVAALLTYQLTGPELLQSPLMWVFMLAPLGLVFFISARINTLSAETARLLFFVYAASMGLSLSTIFHVYTGASITRVFFISAATFGALSLWGYTTRRDLSGFGTFLFMGVIGIVIASLVNLFLRSSGLDWLISVIGVGVFAGLTAYDTQRIKGMYDAGDDAVSAGRKSVMGALSLYLNFINLFMFMLRLMGGRR
jgi:FtsH-binding integral membrane protein